MKVLLTAINAKYIHSNLAILSLKAYANKYREHIELAEYTINNYTDDILQDIYKKKPDMIGFSCYIWNMGIIDELTKELRKVLPKVKIWLGGPEVSYDADVKLKETDSVDGIMMGEGEGTFLELLDYYLEDSRTLSDIKGLAYKPSAYKPSAYKDILSSHEDMEITITPTRPQLDLSTIPFPYEDINTFKNKIIYYETSRGCPYSCSYCLSSIDKQVRLRGIDLVQKELSIFLENQIPQVKFVDRTFNCNKKHAMAIWNYLKENDNGVTNFHFEISADILDEEELSLLSTLREGLVQLEIGVQSTNPQTIEAIHRKMNLDKLYDAVNRIKTAKNIHQHLDLIAGLPYEDYSSFRKSFNEVYSLRPDQFQLGFLKVLKGSVMYLDSEQYHIVYKSTPPYEVLSTTWLNYDEVLELKSVEEMVEVYYNSGQFLNTIQYLEYFHETPFDMYQCLGAYYHRNGLNDKSHSRIGRYEILQEYFKQLLQETDKPTVTTKSELEDEETAFQEFMMYDLYLRENLKSRPVFAGNNGLYKDIFRDFFGDKERMSNLLTDYDSYTSKQISKMTHIEHFTIDLMETLKYKRPIKKENFILFDYQHRNPLNHEAKNFHL